MNECHGVRDFESCVINGIKKFAKERHHFFKVRFEINVQDHMHLEKQIHYLNDIELHWQLVRKKQCE